MGLSVDQTEKALLQRDMSNAKEDIFKPHSAAQACEARDALSKHLYGRLFDWLVKRVNVGISIDDSVNTNVEAFNTIVALLTTKTSDEVAQ